MQEVIYTLLEKLSILHSINLRKNSSISSCSCKLNLTEIVFRKEQRFVSRKHDIRTVCVAVIEALAVETLNTQPFGGFREFH